MLYIDASSGISGDMTVAMLLDLGADGDKLKKVIDSLPVEGATVVMSRVKKSGIDAADFDVVLDAEHENHDHDMEYLYGHSHEHHHGHDHEHEHEHHEHQHDYEHECEHHEHQHGHEHGGHHHHEHRTLADVYEIIDGGVMSPRARDIAKRIFFILGDAEAKAHGTTREEVHFHEVGAIDSIIDIVSVAVCLDDLDITEAIIPALSEGSGMVRCAHGLMPIPVPAVLNIVEEYAIPMRRLGYEGEFVTPTGAAITAAIRSDKPLPSLYRIVKTGYGAGKREHELPGILRGMIIEAEEE